MTPAEQHKAWLEFHRFQMRYELMYTPKINKALKEQVQQYIQRRDTIYVRSGGLYAVLVDLYKTTGVVWARHSARELKAMQKKSGQMGFAERIVQLMQRYFGIDLLNMAEDITQTTIKLIQEVLSDAAQTGISFDEMVKRLISPGFTAKRARLIARTETVAAANAGAMVNAEDTGLELNKIWISARDNRVRPDHREVNQSVVPMHGMFQVGDDLMSQPGDKAGGADNCCNCRCRVAFIPVD